MNQTCSWPNCDNPTRYPVDHYRKGALCTGHLNRRKHSLEMDAPFRPSGKGVRRNIDPEGWGEWGFVSGYVIRYRKDLVTNKTEHQLQHRLVMERHLGRLLIKGENVHHINGVTDDNRLENLELWSTSQPSGQRAIDKLRWAKEIIALYEGKL